MNRLNKLFDKILLSKGIKKGNNIFEFLWNELLPIDWQKLDDKALIKLIHKSIIKVGV